MSRFAVDTNVIVAMAWESHPDHAAATGELERRLTAGDTMVVPAHVLAESYSVLTRLPSPFRLIPVDTATFLEDFVSQAEVTALPADAHVPLLKDAALGRVMGGRIHDMIIAASSLYAGPSILLTFNVRDFAVLNVSLAVREPGRDSSDL